MLSFFKKPTRAEELEAYADSLVSNIGNNHFTPKEVVTIHESVTNKLLIFLESEKSKALIESKRAKDKYKEASYALTTLRNAKDSFI